MRLARLLAGALAVAVCMWFALATRQAHDISQAETIISAANTLSSRQAAHVNSLLDTAGIQNPDQQVNLLRGELATLSHQPVRAARIFQDVADREPLNINAWLLVAQADFRTGRPVAIALSHVAQLDHQAPGGG